MWTLAYIYLNNQNIIFNLETDIYYARVNKS